VFFFFFSQAVIKAAIKAARMATPKSLVKRVKGYSPYKKPETGVFAKKPQGVGLTEEEVPAPLWSK
jgi:hypothetical protein